MEGFPRNDYPQFRKPIFLVVIFAVVFCAQSPHLGAGFFLGKRLVLKGCLTFLLSGFQTAYHSPFGLAAAGQGALGQ